MPTLLTPQRVSVEPISRVSSTAQAASGNTAFSKPSGTAEGDTMLVMVSGRNSNYTSCSISGWTKIFSGSTTSNRVRLDVFLKVAGSSEPTTYTPTGISSSRSIIAVTYRGGTSTINAISSGGWSLISGNQSVGNTITPTETGVLILCGGVGGSASITSGPSAMTQIASLEGYARSAGCYELIDNPPGATGQKAITWNTSSYPTDGCLLQLV